jgi:hypothetical protein
VLAAVRRFEVQLFWVAMLLGVYLAVATLVRGTRHHGSAWEPWHPLFVVMLVAAVFVPIYAFFRALDARELKADAAASKLQGDLELLCQRTVSAIADHCQDTTVNDLSVQVWICRADGGFDRRAAFMLPEARPRSGIEWRKGKGIAGTAWAWRKEVGADLSRLEGELARLGDAEFNRLPDGERYGMTAVEVRKTTNYAGIYAIPLFAVGDPKATLGVFVIDYTGAGGFGCVQRCAQNRPVRVYAAACEEILTEARPMPGV